jgi:hypothetical protein
VLHKNTFHSQNLQISCLVKKTFMFTSVYVNFYCLIYYVYSERPLFLIHILMRQWNESVACVISLGLSIILFAASENVQNNGSNIYNCAGIPNLSCTPLIKNLGIWHFWLGNISGIKSWGYGTCWDVCAACLCVHLVAIFCGN